MNFSERTQRHDSQRGSSLIELSIVVAVLGVVAIGAALWSNVASRETAVAADRDLLEISERAAIGFAHAHYRLPCPSSNNGGLEDCTTGQFGYFPWRTVGVPQISAGKLRYGIYRNPNAASPWLDMDLAVNLHRLRPLFMEGAQPFLPDVSDRTVLLTTNLIDFCYAVTLASNTVSSSNPTSSTTAAVPKLLAVLDKDNSQISRPVAFVIAASGQSSANSNGNPFGGINATASSANPTFESTNRAQTATYDDRVSAVSFDTLFSQLDCGQGLSAIGHSHVNTATAAAFMQQAAIDYKVQLKILDLLAGAGVASSTASVLSAAAGLSLAVAEVATSVGGAAATEGFESFSIPFSVASLVSNTLAVASAAINLGMSVGVKQAADDRVSDVESLITTSAARAVLINANAHTANILGF